MLTLTFILALAAFVCTLLAASGRTPLWVAVLLVTLALLIQIIPVR